MHQGQVALGVDHHPFGLGPQRARQKDVGVAVGLGVEESVLGDHQLGGLQAFDDGLPVRHAGHRVGADNPAGFDLSSRHLLEHRHGAAAGLAWQAVVGDLPQVLDKGAVGLDQHRTLPWQAGAHVAHFAPAHGVGLPGQGKRSAARAADGTRGQVQVAQGIGVPGAVGALVEAHGPATHPLGSLADPVGGLADIGFGKAGYGCDPVWRVILQKRGHRLPALGEGRDKGRVGVAVLDQQVQQAIEQGEVGAGRYRQEQVGLVRRGTASGVDHDQLSRRP